MELSRNKVIFFIVGGILLFFLVIILLIMLFTSDKKSKNSGNGKDFVIWTVGDDISNVSSFSEGFKKYAGTGTNIVFNSFNNYEDYSLALTYAISSGNAPDIFVLNNNEKNSLFENQIIGIPPKVVSPDYFRRNYKDFITEQLLTKNEQGTEFLIGVPVGYETLGIFYNRSFVNNSDVSNFSNLTSAISRIKEKNSSIIPIAIGNGTTVPFSEDITTQFILSEGDNRSLSSLSKKAIQKGIANYYNFGDKEGENAYNTRFDEMKVAGQNSIDLFSAGETYMVVGYPKLINEISQKGFSPSKLLASPFPNDSSAKATIVNYNYFVINKDTAKNDLAEKFMKYISIEEGATKYFEAFPYYLPAYIPLEENMSEQKIHSKFDIKIESFYNDDYNYTSFDKGTKTIYDTKIREIFDKEENMNEEFSAFQRSLTCVTNKVINQTDFSKECK